MDDVNVREGEVRKGLENLAGKLADEVERDAGELHLLQELKQVEGKVLKHEADVLAVVKHLLELDHAPLVFGIHAVQELQKLHLRLGLPAERLLGLDHLNRNLALLAGFLQPASRVKRRDDLPERPLAHFGENFVSAVEGLPNLDLVVVVAALYVPLALLLALLPVVDLVDVLVSPKEVRCELRKMASDRWNIGSFSRRCNTTHAE